MFQFIISIIILILFIYYITVVIHLMGYPMFKKTEVKFWHALIPFYYWGNGNLNV